MPLAGSVIAGYHTAMTAILRPIAIALAVCLSLTLVQSASADGRADWRNYAWQSIDISSCNPGGSALACPPFHEKWDWKRDQWVDIAITLNPASGKLGLSQRLTNNDEYDYDHVCVTVIVVDAAGQNLIAHHQNWLARRNATMQEDFTYHSERLASATTIHLGSKQCREGRGQDDDVYQSVLARLSS